MTVKPIPDGHHTWWIAMHIEEISAHETPKRADAFMKQLPRG